MRVKLCGHCDSSAEEEERVEDIKTDQDQWVAGKILLEGCRDQVNERQHSKNRHKHVVVDDRWVAGVRRSDHISDKRHDEQSPEELSERSVNGAESAVSFATLTWRPRIARLTILATMVMVSRGGVMSVWWR